MEAAFVLLHSLLLGPLTWAPVADRLAAAGRVAMVPSLLDVTDADPPYWPRVVGEINDAVDRLPPGQPVFLIAHSNAGLFVPVVAQACHRPVAGCLFVETALPPRAGTTPAAPPERLAFLRTKATDGLLPLWTRWWDEDEVARMLPDPRTRSAVAAEQRRLPLRYYEQEIPAPAGWDERPCGYLLFGPPYEQTAQEARERGWDVGHLPGRHLHHLVEPAAVAAHITAVTGRWVA